MKRLIPLALLVLLIAGCTDRDLVGPSLPEAEPEPEHEPLPGQTLFQVRYEVEGTYSTCDISFIDTERNLVMQHLMPASWTHTFEAWVPSTLDPFDARVRATCADPTKNGRAHLAIYVDDMLKATAKLGGYGATAEATYLLQRR